MAAGGFRGRQRGVGEGGPYRIAGQAGTEGLVQIYVELMTPRCASEKHFYTDLVPPLRKYRCS